MDELTPVPSMAAAKPGPVFSPLDTQFARFMTRRSGLSGTAADSFELLIKRLSASLADGHSCLMLSSAEEQFLSTIKSRRWWERPYLHGDHHPAGALAQQALSSALLSL